MIFNTDNNYYDGPVAPSPYPVGLEGALMHVYENECNYNALMKAVGISELKYYQETGRDLFVHEAGALSGFIEKAKAFFKKVIEKIKQIFHKFAAVINQYTLSDKEFIKKYSKELYRKNLSDFDFDGYTFKDLNTAITKSLAIPKQAEFSEGDRQTYMDKNNTNDTKTSDQIDDEIESGRGILLDKLGGTSGKYDESEFREELHELLYGGDKETLDKINIRDWLNYISDTKDQIKKVEKQQKELVKSVDDFIKELDKWETEVNKKDAVFGDSLKQKGAVRDTPISDPRKDKVTKIINYEISLYKALSNTYTIAFGMITQAVKDRNRQAKAICVKAIGYNKKESANYGYYGESSVDDLFAGVTIR